MHAGIFHSLQLSLLIHKWISRLVFVVNLHYLLRNAPALPFYIRFKYNLKKMHKEYSALEVASLNTSAQEGDED